MMLLTSKAIIRFLWWVHWEGFSALGLLPRFLSKYTGLDVGVGAVRLALSVSPAPYTEGTPCSAS